MVINISLDIVTDFIKDNISAFIFAFFWFYIYEKFPRYLSNPLIIVIFIFSLILVLMLFYFQRRKKEKKKLEKLKNKYIGYYGKTDDLKPSDFRIAEYRDYFYETEEYKIVSKLVNDGKNVIIIGKPKAGKTRAIYESIKEIKDFYVIKFLEKSIDIQEIPDYIFKGKIIVFLDDLNKFVSNLNLYELIKKLDENSVEFTIVATCRSGKEYGIVEENFADDIREFNVIELKDIDNNIANFVSKKECLDIKEFDGTIGSLFLGIKDMRVRYNSLPEESKFLFQTLNLLHDARIFIPNLDKLKKINVKRIGKEKIRHHLSFESAF